MLRLGIGRLLNTSFRAPLTCLRQTTVTSGTIPSATMWTRWNAVRSFANKVPANTPSKTTTTEELPSFITGFSTQGHGASSAHASATPSTQFKTYKPTTPGKRWLKRVPRDHLYKGKAVRSLTVAKRSSGGRNNTGRITIRHRGGGHKRRIRIIDWHRKEAGAHVVVRLEHDPGRTAWIALLKHQETGKLSYIVAPNGVKAGDTLYSYRSVAKDATQQEDDSITRTAAIDVGNCMPLKMLPVGTIIHNIGLKRNGPAVMARAAGNYAQLIQTGDTGYAQVRLSSGEVRLVPVDACATIGAVSNPDHQHEMLGKAGRSRWMGIRPTVRGMAMNAVDHPHGGGRGKSKGNKDPRSPWGVLAKGGKTRKRPNQFVVKPRPRR
ncbi:translation protein SH3-like domain-containing protein [Radiomyces spectabilis]|uniref:translation protein SH3-like domain-containing protein n=1 Tax=Radiomyces spectabilis TaxID=64574 RepID=UPI00221E97C2|nr:translation protein SH3-like domain-containing protein [Radiomyces spectabilis]KAI8365344.1 translation protein SH3-like domain-containing protein [Radiomyces spectabilis]